jgi:hypothetical protein
MGLFADAEDLERRHAIRLPVFEALLVGDGVVVGLKV